MRWDIVHSEQSMTVEKQTLVKKQQNQIKDIHQGDCVQIINDKNLFQVIGIDINHKKCWLRRWPLHTNGSPVFEISTNEVIVNTN